MQNARSIFPRKIHGGNLMDNDLSSLWNVVLALNNNMTNIVLLVVKFPPSDLETIDTTLMTGGWFVEMTSNLISTTAL